MSPFRLSERAVAVVIGLAGLLSACYPSEDSRSTISCPSQPNSGPGVSRIDLQAEVTQVASGNGAIWAVRRRHGINEGPSDLVEVDPQSSRIVGRPIRLESLAEDLEIGQGAVWVARRRGILARVDADSHEVVAEIRVGRAPTSVAVGESGIWVANGNDNTVSRIDPSTNRVIATIPVGDHPDLVLEAAGSVWVRAVYGGGGFQRIDPSTNRVTATGEMELQAVGPDAVWVIAPGGPNGILRRLDPTTLRPVGPPLGLDILPASIGIADRDLWVGKYFYYCELHNPIPEGPPIISFAWFRVDPVSLRALSGPVFVGSNAGAPAFADDAFWIAPDFENELLKLDLGTAARVRSTPTPACRERTALNMDAEGSKVEPLSSTVHS